MSDQVPNIFEKRYAWKYYRGAEPVVLWTTYLKTVSETQILAVWFVFYLWREDK